MDKGACRRGRPACATAEFLNDCSGENDEEQR
jgi:hypothetical protein